MFRPKFETTTLITTALAAIEHARGFLEAASLSADWVASVQNKALLLEAYHTTHIEGTQLTLDQSKQIWEGKSVAAVNSDDVKELLNYKKAFELVSHYINSGAPITEGLIREIHKHLVKDVRGNSAAPGEYRKIQNYVVNSQTKEVIYTPPPVYEIPAMMQELVEWINHETIIHPVLIAGIAQFQLVHIHPFLDGNGRTARLLSTLCLYRRGYDFKKLFTISEYYDKNLVAYYHAIQNVRENNMNMSEWLEYFTHGLSEQLREIKTLGKQTIQHQLSAKQKIAIEYIQEHGQLTMQEFEKLCPDVSRRTLQRELRDLINKNIIETSGATSRLVYKLKFLE